MTKGKPKPKPSKPPAIVNQPQEESSEEQKEQQFQVELYWCIHQLQTALNSLKLNQRDTKEHTSGLKVLTSNAPLVRKRQVMRLAFGDYRSKMAAEEKKFNKVNMQVKLSAGKPSDKSVFVKKAVDGSFKFCFDVEEEEKLEHDVVKEGNEEKQSSSNYNFNFKPCGNSFKFNFEVDK